MPKALKLAQAQVAIQEVVERLKLDEINFNILVSGVVKIAQEARLEGNYALSDSLRKVLNSAGIETLQGTAGYAYPEIPEALKGRPIADTWKIKA